MKLIELLRLTVSNALFDIHTSGKDIESFHTVCKACEIPRAYYSCEIKFIDVYSTGSKNNHKDMFYVTICKHVEHDSFPVG